jgi:hypothetical protein
MWQKRPAYVAKETYHCSTRQTCQQQGIRPTAIGLEVKRPVHVAKETCVCGKRDLRMWQKRPTTVGLEVNLPTTSKREYSRI